MTGRSACDLSVVRNAGAHGGDEDVLRIGDLLAVGLPLDRRVASAMVGEQNQRGVIAVLGICLRELPEALQVNIDAVRRFEIAAVVAGVRPVVRLAQRQIEEPRMFCLEVFDRGVKRWSVEGFVAPDARQSRPSGD